MDPASDTTNGAQPTTPADQRTADGGGASPISLPPPPKSARSGAPSDKQDGPGMADLASAVVDDGDLIEKEWVNRVKHIIASNRNDPYKQSEQLAALRAEYMKKRYGKDIKLGK